MHRAHDMHGKLVSAALAVTFLSTLALLSSPPQAIADKKTEDTKSAVKSETKAGDDKRTTKAAPPKAAPQKESTKVAAAKKVAAANKSAVDKAANVKAKAAAPAAVEDDVPWYERPLAAPPKATEPATKPSNGKAKGKSKAKAEAKAAPERSGAIGLGSRSGRTPVASAEEAPRAVKLDRNAVITTLRENEASFAYCRAKAERRGEKSAEMILSFRVDANGRAVKISVADMSGAKAPAMSKCLSRRMKSWSFPAKTAGGAIEYPLMVQQIGPASK